MVTVVQSAFPAFTHVKRFHVTGTILTAACPQCGLTVSKDLGDDYLEYPEINKPFEVFFSHDIEEPYDHHEWPERVILRITLVGA